MRPCALTLSALVILSVLPHAASAQPSRVPRRPVLTQDATFHSGFQSLASKGTLRTLVIGGVLTGLATHYDSRSGGVFNKAPFGKSAIMEMGDDYGNGRHLMAASLTAWGSGLLLRSNNLEATGRALTLGLLADGFLVTSIKSLSRRKRPDGSDRRSFPSGHTSGAFTASTVLSRRYGWRAGVPAYALATLTAMDRMEDKKHYASDVVAGAVLGIVIGRAVTATEHSPDSRLKVVPSGLGAKLSLSFW